MGGNPSNAPSPPLVGLPLASVSPFGLRHYLPPDEASVYRTTLASLSISADRLLWIPQTRLGRDLCTPFGPDHYHTLPICPDDIVWDVYLYRPPLLP